MTTSTVNIIITRVYCDFSVRGGRKNSLVRKQRLTFKLAIAHWWKEREGLHFPPIRRWENVVLSVGIFYFIYIRERKNKLKSNNNIQWVQKHQEQIVGLRLQCVWRSVCPRLILSSQFRPLVQKCMFIHQVLAPHVLQLWAKNTGGRKCVRQTHMVTKIKLQPTRVF